MECVVEKHTNPLLTISEAKRAAKFDLVANIILGNQILKLFNDITRALNVTTTSNTNNYFHKTILSKLYLTIFICELR